MLKVLALLAGAAGIAGFFLPLAEYRDSTGEHVYTASPYQIATTEHDTSGVGELARKLGADDDQADQIETAAENSMLISRGVVIAAYVPAALLALFALINLFRRRMGRIAGFVVILLGAANGAAFAYFWIGNHRNAGSHTSLGYGVWALAIAGALGILAGVITMFAPKHD
jgi:hypothetical protein